MIKACFCFLLLLTALASDAFISLKSLKYGHVLKRSDHTESYLFYNNKYIILSNVIDDISNAEIIDAEKHKFENLLPYNSNYDYVIGKTLDCKIKLIELAQGQLLVRKTVDCDCNSSFVIVDFDFDSVLDVIFSDNNKRYMLNGATLIVHSWDYLYSIDFIVNSAVDSCASDLADDKKNDSLKTGTIFSKVYRRLKTLITSSSEPARSDLYNNHLIWAKSVSSVITHEKDDGNMEHLNRLAEVNYNYVHDLNGDCLLDLIILSQNDHENLIDVEVYLTRQRDSTLYRERYLKNRIFFPTSTEHLFLEDINNDGIPEFVAVTDEKIIVLQDRRFQSSLKCIEHEISYDVRSEVSDEDSSGIKLFAVEDLQGSNCILKDIYLIGSDMLICVMNNDDDIVVKQFSVDLLSNQLTKRMSFLFGIMSNLITSLKSLFEKTTDASRLVDINLDKEYRLKSAYFIGLFSKKQSSLETNTLSLVMTVGSNLSEHTISTDTPSYSLSSYGYIKNKDNKITNAQGFCFRFKHRNLYGKTLFYNKCLRLWDYLEGNPLVAGLGNNAAFINRLLLIQSPVARTQHPIEKSARNKLTKILPIIKNQCSNEYIWTKEWKSVVPNSILEVYMHQHRNEWETSLILRPNFQIYKIIIIMAVVFILSIIWTVVLYMKN